MPVMPAISLSYQVQGIGILGSLPSEPGENLIKELNMTDAHDGAVTHHYTMHYPAHPPRKSDPHYKDFEAFRKRTKATAKCAVGEHRDDYSECSGGLELHHAHVEFSLQNGVDLKWLEKDYPGISDPNSVGAWVESAANLMWLCEFHHRGHGGVHVASASDFEASKYVKDLIS